MRSFLNLQVKQKPEKIVPDAPSISAEQLGNDPAVPITLHQVNALPQNAKLRIYRALMPLELLTRFKIDPISWNSSAGEQHTWLQADQGTNHTALVGSVSMTVEGEFLRIELSDNAINGIDLHMLVLSNPAEEYFRTDFDENNQPTHFGTARRNLVEEQRAMQAGLAPGQTRRGLGASAAVFQQLESFLAALGHRAYFLEPLTYASAWVFERRGFAYVRGHKLMDDIHREFLPAGKLHRMLDGGSPFRQSDQWKSVRGRAWAIQDGVLEALETRWDGLRMVKQIGRHAQVETFPQAQY
ncbi:MAG: hypothetical protein A2Z16_03405 [Chloroflexi bacterium RBG_16_54_18]|nr:MAG: hypothetical protein A2Z16_03405 [Chloroflexi bacterium RBG_16_54_18]